MKKVNINHIKIMMSIAIILTASVLTMCFSGVFASLNTDTPNSTDEAVIKYIENMKNQNFDAIQDMVKPADIGYDAKVYTYKFMNEFVKGASEQALSKPYEILTNQYEFIKEKFGEDAWSNVTYKIVKKNCPSKKEEFVNTETGDVISEKESIDITENYWNNFAEERGIDYNEFLTPKEYSGESDKKENMDILTAMESGYMPPVKVNLVDEYDFYEVYLSFNGKSETSDGENTFRISIDNSNKNLKVCYGLRWSVPLSDENMGDI